MDFHLAAVHGVRLEVPEALAAGRRVLDGARRLAQPRQEARAWILIGQAQAATADRARAAQCGRQAVALAPDDAEITALALQRPGDHLAAVALPGRDGRVQIG